MRLLKQISQARDHRLEEVDVTVKVAEEEAEVKAEEEAEEIMEIVPMMLDPELVSLERMIKETMSLILNKRREVDSKERQETLIHLTNTLEEAEERETPVRRRVVLVEVTTV